LIHSPPPQGVGLLTVRISSASIVRKTHSSLLCSIAPFLPNKGFISIPLFFFPLPRHQTSAFDCPFSSSMLHTIRPSLLGFICFSCLRGSLFSSALPTNCYPPFQSHPQFFPSSFISTTFPMFVAFFFPSAATGDIPPVRVPGV